MKSSGTTPPRWLVHLLERFLPEQRGEFLIGDLEEEFKEVFSQRGGGAARRWFLAQTCRCLYQNRSRRARSGLASSSAEPVHLSISATAIHDHFRRSRILTAWRADLTGALRRLNRQRGFSAAIILALALGISVNTSMFTLVNGLLLRPLPYPNPEQLVHLGQTLPELSNIDLSYPDFDFWRKETKTLQHMAVYDDVRGLFSGRGAATRLEGSQVSWGLFPTLGVEPMLGRGFTPLEDTVAGEPVILISHRLWTERFQATPDVLGQSLLLGGNPYTITGVMPPGFHFPEVADFWLPVGLDASLEDPLDYSWDAIARLEPGQTVKTAQAEADLIATRLSDSHPGKKVHLGAEVYPLRAADVPLQASQVLWLLLGAVAFVLLIACLNVANLLLVNLASRSQELSLRMALGAGRFRIVRQLLAECLLLGLLGGAFGLALGIAIKDWVVSRIPLQFAYWIHFDLDTRVVAFVVGASLTSVLLVTMFVSVGMGRGSLMGRLRNRNSSGNTLLRQHFRSGLVSAEVALSLCLLIAAGLMMRTFMTLAFQPPGFDSAQTLSLRVWIPAFKYPGGGERQQLQQTLLAEMASAPGVESVAAASELPRRQARVEYFRYSSGQRDELAVAFQNLVSEDYFRLLRIPLLRGRFFEPSDRLAESGGPVIVSRTLAEQLWPDQDAIGRRLKPGREDRPESAGEGWPEIVGVVENVQQGIEWGSPLAAIYYPFASTGRTFSLLARTNVDPAGLGETLRQRIAGIDPDIPVYSIQPLSAVRIRDLWLQQLFTALFSGFGLLALILAAIGIHGLIGFEVVRQRHDLAIRLAIGAHSSQLVRQTLKRGLLPVATGIALGLGLSLGLVRLLESVLYDTSPTDSTTFLLISLILLAVSIGAAYLPARAITRVDPCQALRD